MSEARDGQVTCEVADGVARIVLDRPAKHNAITREMTAELSRVCAAVDGDESARVVLISGAGERAFSAGSDMNELADLTDLWAFRNRVDYAAVVRDMRKPVVAALQGWVLGGGLEIALGSDIRIASDTATLGAPEVTHGWIGGGGVTQMLPRLVGYGQAMRLLLSGERVGAAEAQAMGLVDEVVPQADLQTRAGSLAARIAAHDPVATQSAKAAVRAALSLPLEHGIRYENELHTICMSGATRGDGIAAFQKRKD